MARLGRRRWFSRLGSRVAAPIDRALFQMSHHWLDAPVRRGLPTLMLSTTGRSSGRKRTSPLLYIETADGWAVVGTNWGLPEHPAWSANLLADPRAEAGFGDHSAAVTARQASGDEFEELWARFVAIWPAYSDYRARIDRIPRMFVLTPG